MENVWIWRMRRHNQGTEGILFTNGFNCKVLELPWRYNKQNVSCIPAGEYETTIRVSPRFGTIYWVMKVEERSYILIHSGNWAGDIGLGFKAHTNGCILLGQLFGYLMGQRAVLNSRITIRQFMDHMENKPFTLNIMEAFENK